MRITKQTVLIVMSLLLTSLSLYGTEIPQQQGLKPSSETVFVLKYKKRKVRVSNKEAENIKPGDIKGIDVAGDTIFLHVSDSIIAKYDRNKKVKQQVTNVTHIK